MAKPKKKISPGDGDPRHGTDNGYNNLGCRGDCCRAAWAEYHGAYMHADPERLARHAARERDRRARKKGDK